MHEPSFLWHDYETTGIDPARDHASQFAAIRTNQDLQPIGEPVVWYCQPSYDNLPHPQAVMVTGITPQEALAKGVNEAEFTARIHALMSTPQTCNVGYNTLRFDDILTRHLLYRNFYDPYAREWQNGNSRWDIIDLARMCYALRPAGIEWPEREDGSPSFRLEELATANKLEQKRAHDALSDVETTIALARLIRQRQPRLFDWYLQLRHKRRVEALLDVSQAEPLVHVSSRYPARDGCLRLILPLARHPVNANEIIIAELGVDPTTWIDLSASDIAERLFTAQADLPDGITRPGLRTIHINRSPALAPLSVLKSVDCKRIHLNVPQSLDFANAIRAADSLRAKVIKVYEMTHTAWPQTDPELSLYAGFPTSSDKKQFARIHASDGDALAQARFAFSDTRYDALLFRYRARHWPQTLDAVETAQWQQFRQQRLCTQTDLTSLTLDDYFATIKTLRTTYAEAADKLELLDALQSWGLELQRSVA